MAQLIFLLVLSLSMASHGNSKQGTMIEIDLDNHDPHKIGFIFNPDDQSIGPRSATLFDGKVYIPDPVHNNLKVIDLATSQMETMYITSDDKRVWLRDVLVVNGTIYVSTDLEFIYELHQEDNAVTTRYARPGEKYFFIDETEGILLYYPVGGMSIRYGVVSDDLAVALRTDFFSSCRLDFEPRRRSSGEKIVTPFGTLILPGRYQDLTHYYDGINVWYSHEGIVYFEIDTKENKFRVYAQLTG